MSFLRFTNDPFENVMRLQRAISQSVGQPSFGLDWTPSGQGLQPALDIFEAEGGDTLIVKAELPGIDRESLELPGIDRESLEVENVGNRLTVAGKRVIPTPEGEFRYHRRERQDGEFRRVFRLPFEVDRDKATAAYNDGVLTIRMEKAESAKPRQIAVKS
jgi:HSP20 family molecular chaperone IbpA